MAFLTDPTEEGCHAAVDTDDNVCEFRSYQGVQLCLNEEQESMGEQFGMECDAEIREMSKTIAQDPMDTTCLMAFLTDPTDEGCHAAVDSDGNACEFCSYQGVQLCLNEEQASMGEQFVMECDAEIRGMIKTTDQDPMDVACLEPFLTDPTEEGCHAAVDSDGNVCEFCSY
jgi:hypothetical protein